MFTKIFLFILLVLIIPTYESLHNITITSLNDLSNGTAILTRGIYTPITINIIPISNTTFNTLETKIILSTESKVTTPQKEYPIKLYETRIIETYIGLPCETELTEEEISKGIYISFVSQINPYDFIITKKHILIQNNINEFDIIASSKQIPLKGYGVLSLTKSLYFVDEINISINYNNYNNEFQVETPMKVSMHINEDEYTRSMVKYISKGNTDISNIKLSLSITNEKLTKCYQLSSTSKELEVSVSSSVEFSNTKNKTIPLFFRTESKVGSVFISSINSHIIPNTMLSCVIIDNRMKFPSNEEILLQSEGNYDDNKVRYFKIFFGDNVDNMKFEFNTLNMNILHKYKCAYENNYYLQSNNKQDYTCNYFDSQRTIKIVNHLIIQPYCLIIKKEHNPSDNFHNKIREYILTLLYSDLNDFNKNGCLSVAYDLNNINTNSSMEFVCIYNSNRCKIVPDVNYRDEKIYKVNKTLHSYISSLKNILNINSLIIRNIEAFNYTYFNENFLDDLEIEIQESNENGIKFKFFIYDFNRTYNYHFQIVLNKYITKDEFDFDFSENPITKIFIPLIYHNLTVKYSNISDEGLYSLNIKCSLFSDLIDLHLPLLRKTFPTLKIDHIKGEYFNCDLLEHQYINVHCLHNHLDYHYFMPLNSFLNDIYYLTWKYSILSIEKQEAVLLSSYNNILKQTDFLQLFHDIIVFEGYMDYYDCFKDSKGFKNCLNLKRDLQSEVYGIFKTYFDNNLKYYSDYYENTLSAYDEKNYYYGLTLMFFTMFHNAKTITKELSLLIVHYFSLLLDEFDYFFNYLKKGHGSKFHNELVSIYNGLIPIFSKFIAYNTYNDYISTLEQHNHLYLIYNYKLLNILSNKIGYTMNKTDINDYYYSCNFTNGIRVVAEFQKKYYRHYSNSTNIFHYNFFPYAKLDSDKYFPIGISTKQKDGFYFPEHSPVLSRFGTYTLTFYLSKYNSTIMSCYLFESESNTFNNTKVKSVYDVNHNRLTCTTDVYGDFVLGQGEPELTLKASTINIIYSLIVIIILILIVLISYRCIKKSRLFSKEIDTYSNIKNISV